MSAIVQHKSAVCTTGTTIVLAFDSPVTKGNLIIVGYLVNFAQSPPSSGLSDTQGNSYAQAGNFDTFDNIGIFYTLAKASGTLTVTSQHSLGTNGENQLHIYEVAGYDTLDQAGQNDAAFGEPTAKVFTNGSTIRANEFVFSFIGWRDFNYPADGFPASLTGQAGNEGQEITQQPPDNYAFISQGFEVTSTGVQSAAFSGPSSDGGADDMLIATFYNSSEPSPSSTTPGGASYPMQSRYRNNMMIGPKVERPVPTNWRRKLR